jgi:hypothetical protein
MKLRPNHMSRGNPRLLVIDGVVYLRYEIWKIKLNRYEAGDENLQYDAIMHAHYATESFFAAAFLGLGWLVSLLDVCRVDFQYDVTFQRCCVFVNGNSVDGQQHRHSLFNAISR